MTYISRNSRLIRVLHVVGSLNIGGVENWLLQVLQQIDRERFQLDVLVHREQAGALEDRAVSAGAAVIRCQNPHRFAAYAPAFIEKVRSRGYDIVHSHVHLFSGLVGTLSTIAGVHARIAHAHSDTSRSEAQQPMLRRNYARLMRMLIRRSAQLKLAVSQEAGLALFGKNEGAWQVHYCGVDLTPLSGAAPDRSRRSEFGFSERTRVFAHVGRLAEEKNQQASLTVLRALQRLRPEAHLLFIGDGKDREKLVAEAARQGLTRNVTFLGWRHDVLPLLRDVCDVVLAPSKREGLPLAVVEAQAAGVPVVMSDHITPEVDVIPALMHRVPLESPCDDWVEACLATMDKRPMAAQTSLKLLRNSDFEMERSVRRLESLYVGLLARVAAA